MLQLLFWFCYACAVCAVWRIIWGFACLCEGAYGPFVSRVEINTDPFNTILCLMANQYTMWRESTFCRAAFSGCSTGAMIHPGEEKHRLSLCCFPIGNSLVWERRHGVHRICFPLSREYLKWRKMSSVERVTTTKFSEGLKTKFEQRKGMWKGGVFFQIKHNDSLSYAGKNWCIFNTILVSPVAY